MAATIEELEKALNEQKANTETALAELNAKIAAQDKTIDAIKANSGVPAKEKPAPSFKPEAAKNLDESGKPENEFHFELNKQKFRFTAAHVTPPASKDNASPTKVTALVAQSDKELQGALVKIKSGQIKEVL